MSIWGVKARQQWPIGVIWFATFLVFLGTSYGTKRTYRSSINAFNTIYAIMGIETPFKKQRAYPERQVNIFMALATMASYKAATTCRVAKSAAEDAWLLQGNTGPIIDAVLWKRMYKGIEVYKGNKLAEKVAILPSQVKAKIVYMLKQRDKGSIDYASIILADICGVLLGLRRSEFLAAVEKKPDRTTLLCFQNLAGDTWDLADGTKKWDIDAWAKQLSLDEVIRVRLCYTKHQRHRVAHQVIAGPGHKLMSFVFWIKIIVSMRIKLGEKLAVDSPLLVRKARGKIVPLTGNFVSQIDKIYAPILGWSNATIHSRRRGFATAAVKCGLHMAKITIAMRHSQGVTMQYVSLSTAEKATFTTRLAIASYEEEPENEIS